MVGYLPNLTINLHRVENKKKISLKITSFQTYSEQSGNMNKDSPMNLFQRNNRTSTQS